MFGRRKQAERNRLLANIAAQAVRPPDATANVGEPFPLSRGLPAPPAPLDDLPPGLATMYLNALAQWVEQSIPPGEGPRGKAVFLIAIYGGGRVPKWVTNDPADDESATLAATREIACKLAARVTDAPTMQEASWVATVGVAFARLYQLADTILRVRGNFDPDAGGVISAARATLDVLKMQFTEVADVLNGKRTDAANDGNDDGAVPAGGMPGSVATVVVTGHGGEHDGQHAERTGGPACWDGEQIL